MKKLINKVRAIIEGKSHLRKEWDRCEKKLNNKQITSVQFHDRINEARVFAGSDVVKRSIFTLLTIGMLFSSCEKETYMDCSCGIVVSDGITNNFDYYLDIKNDCSGNIQRWYVSASDWYSAYVGNNWCIYNADKW